MSTLCRSCGTGALQPFLALGETPLANSLLTADDLAQPEPRFPLEVGFCPECSLVQLLATVPPEKMFSEYLYFSSNSTTMVGHCKALVDRLVDERDLDSDSLAMEIASNDGYLLASYLPHKVPVLGIEPAANVAAAAVERGVATEVAFFGRETAAKLLAAGRRADVLHANNVLGHVPDLNGMAAGIASVLKDGGVAVIEVPYVKDLVDNLEFDTIYHEHVFYFSLSALVPLFRRHGLELRDVERLPIHGGSLRLFAGRRGQPGDRVLELLEQEKQWGLTQLAYYEGFSARVNALGDSLRGMLDGLRADGKRLAAYGASAKGSTLLNFFGIGTDRLEFVVDRSPHKQGRFMPGVHLPIFAPEKLLEAKPDVVLLLTWNLAEEIVAQQAEFLRQGGQFLIPIPQPRLVSA